MKTQRSFDRSLSHSEPTPGALPFDFPELTKLTKKGSLPILTSEDGFGNSDVNKFNEPPPLRGINPYFRAFFQDNLWNVLRTYVSPISSPIEPKQTLQSKDFRRKNSFQQISFDISMETKVNLVLRVMPTNPKLKSEFSTRSRCFNYVYVSSDAIEHSSESASEPYSFVASMTRLRSRKERIAAMILERKSLKANNMKNIPPLDGKLSSAVVRVIVIQSSELSLMTSAKNCIMCSSVLRQQLGLPLTSLVHLTSVAAKPIFLSSISLYAIRSLVSRFCILSSSSPLLANIHDDCLGYLLCICFQFL